MSHTVDQPKTSSSVFLITMVFVTIFSWLYMQWTHELGHIIVGKFTGAQIHRLILDPRSFSMTQFVSTPKPLLTTWGGPILGVLIGASIPLLLARKLKYQRSALYFIAAFVLLANGLYIGLGVVHPVGDTHVMHDLDTPKWMMLLFALATLIPARLLLRQSWSLRTSDNNRITVRVLVPLTIILVALGLFLLPETSR